ncbi:PfkB family carbohydrate kinase [Daejeonella sp.]|uniref:PfkB family carbohydrate kinase n=1 Tax=Daejeonella sp. TaxID=2805397 RepID=UPI0030C16741
MSTEFFEKYKYKLKSQEELVEIIGAFPREKKVIICHGVFDVVHPGHVRHLAYAKTKADILVVTLTQDKHIKKGIYRPHIPEGLRALNLAAFEMVDYVLIDENATPLNILKEIQPDFFAKGFEYASSGLPRATQAEADVVDSYGGQMIFTPGDVVYSSSKFLNLSLPQLQLEKLLLLMQLNDISFDNLRVTILKLSDYHVHVVGDTIVDTYTRTTFIGGQTKTPTFSVLYQGEDNYIGGAGIVAQHLRAAGAKVTFSTILGNDKLKDFVIDGLIKSGVETSLIIDQTRPTSHKNAIISGGYRLLKLDTLDNTPISEEILQKLTNSIQQTPADAVVFSDFRHGIFNRSSVKTLTKAIPAGVFRVADSQVASRWGNITEFKKFDLITPNEREARFALANQDSGVGRLASFLLEDCDCNNLILKLGDKGIFCVAQNEELKTPAFSIDSFANYIVDAVGAGDALLAYSTLTMLATGSLVMAGIIGSMAAACECEIDGNIPIRTQNILAKIDEVEKMIGYKTS